MEETEDYSFLIKDHNAAILQAREIVNSLPVYIDTETTGLGPDAEIVDISVVDHDGTVILNTLIKPTRPIPADAISKHGITNEMVACAPTFADVWPLIRALLRGRTIVTYNAEYDARLIRQSMTVSGYYGPAIEELNKEAHFVCAMLLFAQFYGAWNDYYQSYRWQRLSLAAKEAGYPEWKEHRALGDTLATRAVMLYLAGQKVEGENG